MTSKNELNLREILESLGEKIEDIRIADKQEKEALRQQKIELERTNKGKTIEEILAEKVEKYEGIKAGNNGKYIVEILEDSE